MILTSLLHGLHHPELLDNRGEGVGYDGQDDEEGEQEDHQGRHDQPHVTPGHLPALIFLCGPGSLQLELSMEYGLSTKTTWITFFINFGFVVAELLRTY